MEIKEKFGALTKAQLFNMSKGIGCTLLKNVEEGTEFEAKAAVIMTDWKKDIKTGDPVPKDILHIFTTTGEIYTTESPTVIDTFTMAAEYMETVNLRFRLTRQKSKNGRTFMDLELLSLDDSDWNGGK